MSQYNGHNIGWLMAVLFFRFPFEVYYALYFEWRYAKPLVATIIAVLVCAVIFLIAAVNIIVALIFVWVFPYIVAVISSLCYIDFRD